MINMSKELKRPENMSNSLGKKNTSRCERKTNRGLRGNEKYNA